MFTPINPVNEQRRAENNLRSFTEQEHAANLFARPQRASAPAQPEMPERAVKGDGIRVTQLFKAIRLNRDAGPAPQINYADKRATQTS